MFTPRRALTVEVEGVDGDVCGDLALSLGLFPNVVVHRDLDGDHEQDGMEDRCRRKRATPCH
jgi:hypothetical protein